MKWFFYSILIVVYINYTQCYNILAFNNLPCHSHSFVMESMLNGLLDNGHNVTYLNALETKNSRTNNYTRIKINFNEIFDYISAFERRHLTTFYTIYDMYSLGERVCDVVFNDKSISMLTYKRADNQAKFDLIITSQFVSECLLAALQFENAPIIAVGTSGPITFVNELVGLTSSPATVPHTFGVFPVHMNLYQRMHNVLLHIAEYLMRQFWYLPRLNSIIKQYVPNSSSIQRLINERVSLVFVNSNWITRRAREMPPNMIEIGGIHIKLKHQMDPELKYFMDNAPHGVIYFSLGSNIKQHSVPKTMFNNFLKVFTNIPQKVIWKTDNTNFSLNNANIKIGKWFPQQDILAHPNLRAFISHGGLLSVTEASYFGVPILGLPVFNDQYINVLHSETNGYGIGLDLNNITEHSFKWAVNEILQDKYFINAKKMSKIIQDNVTAPPVIRAVKWCEYVIRHNGASHLKTLNNSVSLFQLYLLDVISIFILVLVLIFIVITFIIKQTIKYVFVKTKLKQKIL